MSALRAARDAMGTRFEILLSGPDRAQLRAVAEEALDEIFRLDQRWSRFREDSELSDLNRRAATEPVRTSADLMELLIRACELWEATGGAFDPGLGNLMPHCGFRRETATRPAGERDLSDALAVAGMRHIELHPLRREVRFRRPGPQLDLGAIGKGYALDVAAEVVCQEGVDSGLIHAGTSSVVAIGPPRGEAWKIGVPTVEAARHGWTVADYMQEPRRKALLAQVELKDSALGVSAPWGQATCHDGRHLGHILDPRTGRPVEAVLLAAVLAPRATDADALATALVVGGAALQRKLAAAWTTWRSLVVVRDPEGGPSRVIDQGLATGR